MAESKKKAETKKEVKKEAKKEVKPINEVLLREVKEVEIKGEKFVVKEVRGVEVVLARKDFM